MRSLNRRDCEIADGFVPPEAWASSIIKITCILIIGVTILNGVVIGTNLSANSTFYGLMTSVQGSITSGYTLLSLLILVVGSGAILHFLGFM
jgi:hypothetical protein